ncbi:hypothetical protein N7466_006023 [Penicillium verhagenii]|uniref:uncharacterized protein n=1 Tax=Penicillium verhagenii TaxID=1562060 RepID=UPI0025457EA6|nr:uncharacterized protein N7466_006023 [Penicillium verhagenii]KAJ5930530.1 hypothetical protein N7466_006023 [Penicillium verhagenii]
MEDVVIPLFFNSFLYLPKDPDIRNGFMEILPEMFSKAGIGSHLHTSTLAVAFFTVAAWTGQDSLLRSSQQFFTQALPKIRETLFSNDANEYEDVLMSILMLSTYEEFLSMRDWKMPMKDHLKGAIAFVNSRKPARIQGPSSSILHNAVQAQIIKTTRGLETPMVPIPKVWPLSLPKTPPSPRVFLSLASAETVSLRQSWEKLKAEDLNETEVKSFLDKATQIDTNLVSWTYLIPEHWNSVPATIIPKSVREAGLYLHRCDCYTDMWVATTWNTYRDCRILVQSIMLECLRLFPASDPDGSKAAAIQLTINKMADDVCASVPYYLGSQTESVRLKQDLITYPFAESRPVTHTHRQSAPLAEQISWVAKQTNRAMVIYFQR